ncbi:SDR family NAD(P)-dependent oxidoreductase [Mucilaginibacter paludis]|nr:SDR family NAD(P)-dependent oxidoreductase [Mucilaginibacter paludis]
MEQRKAIVVGASSGIGKELAILLAAQGYTVGITGRRQELLNDLQQKYPGNFTVSCFDVSDTVATTERLGQLTQQLNGLDLIVICAGYGDNNPDLDHRIEQATINTNITGFTAVADWAYQYFKQQSKGHIVNISSIAGLRGSGGAPSYSATKAYQINYLEALQQKANKGKDNIKITDVRPGFVDTAMAKAEQKFWVSSPQKAAADIVDAIKKQKQVIYVTKRWRLIAVLLKLLPRLWYTKL